MALPSDTQDFGRIEITTPTHHSDILFQPHLAASFDPTTIFNLPSFKETVKRIDGRELGPNDLPREPLILTGLMNDWPAFNQRLWTLPKLCERFPAASFRAEATLTTLEAYQNYHDESYDDSPLYLFDSDFVEKTLPSSSNDERGLPGLGDDYTVPSCFSEDLFSVMGSKRPDYRWLVRSVCSRSYSTTLMPRVNRLQDQNDLDRPGIRILTELPLGMQSLLERKRG